MSTHVDDVINEDPVMKHRYLSQNPHLKHADRLFKSLTGFDKKKKHFECNSRIEVHFSVEVMRQVNHVLFNKIFLCMLP